MSPSHAPSTQTFTQTEVLDALTAALDARAREVSLGATVGLFSTTRHGGEPSASSKNRIESAQADLANSPRLSPLATAALELLRDRATREPEEVKLPSRAEFVSRQNYTLLKIPSASSSILRSR
jgi:hypothetical protein